MNIFFEKTFEGLFNEFILHYCGRRIKNISHSFGPFEQDSYLLYYIKEGRADLIIDGEHRVICEKGFFVNFPKSGCIYHSYANEPWSIKWISAGGEILEHYLSLVGITREEPFMPIRNGNAVDKVFDEMYELFDEKSMSAKFRCVSLFHRLFGLLAEESEQCSTENLHIARALELIEESYSRTNLSVDELARSVGLNPNYFSILFKRETGRLPKQVITELRLSNSCKMLRFTDRPIKQIAFDNGFSDELYFSRTFREHYGCSPSEYRKKEEYLT